MDGSTINGSNAAPKNAAIPKIVIICLLSITPLANTPKCHKGGYYINEN